MAGEERVTTPRRAGERGAGQYALLDWARGLAALAVVFHHRGIRPDFPPLANSIIELGYVGVSIFFVISGFVIYQSAERHFAAGTAGMLQFAGKRLRRIYPAFWMSLLLCLGISTFILNPANDNIPDAIYHWTLYPPPFSLADIAGTAVLIYNVPPLHLQPPNVVYWTLVVEQQFYVAMAVLILPLFRRVRTGLILASTVLAVAHGLGWFGVRTASFYVLSRHWLEFVLGILVYFIVRRTAPRWLTVPLFLAVVAAGLAPTWPADNPNGPRSVAAALFAVLILVIYPLDRRLVRIRALAPLRWLGRISYSLYLVHLAGFALNDWVFAGVLPKGGRIGYAAGVGTALLLAALFYWGFERPFLSARRRPAPPPTSAPGPVLPGPLPAEAG